MCNTKEIDEDIIKKLKEQLQDILKSSKIDNINKKIYSQNDSFCDLTDKHMDMVENKDIEIICPICKEVMIQYTSFGVSYINDVLCAFVVAGDCKCGKAMTVKIPINLEDAFV